MAETLRAMPVLEAAKKIEESAEETLITASNITRKLSPIMRFTPSSPRPRSLRVKLAQLDLFSFIHLAAPRTSRQPSSLTARLEWLDPYTLSPSFGVGRYHPRRYTNTSRPAAGDSTNPQCANMLSYSARLCGRRGLRSPEGFRYILHPVYRDSCQIHLYERFLHTAFPPAVPLYDGRLKGNTLEARHIQSDIARGRGKVSS